MAITKQISGNTVIYSLGEEKVLSAETEVSEKITLKFEGAIKTLVAACLDEVIKNALAENKDIVIDFSGVSYIASAGMRVLLNMQQEIDENEEPDVVITGLQPSVRDVFEQTGFINILNIAENN